MMNHYGQEAQQMWRKYAPRQYEMIEDPERHFSELGDSILAQVVEVEGELSAQLPGGLTFAERFQQLQMIRKQAEELVLNDLVFGPIGRQAGSTNREALETALNQLPSPAMVDDLIAQQDLSAWEEAAREDWEHPRLSEEQQQQRRYWEQLKSLVGVDSEHLDEQQAGMLLAELNRIQPPK